MRLAEALLLRADHQKRLDQLQQRLVRSAKIQEGDAPPEDPDALMAEVEQVSAELLRLIQRINATNSATEIRPGTTLTDALALRDVLMRRRTLYSALATAATVTQERYSKSEVRFRSTVNVAETQKLVDRLSREHRELDTLVQETNWKTELIE